MSSNAHRRRSTDADSSSIPKPTFATPTTATASTSDKPAPMLDLQLGRAGLLIAQLGASSGQHLQPTILRCRFAPAPSILHDQRRIQSTANVSPMTLSIIILHLQRPHPHSHTLNLLPLLDPTHLSIQLPHPQPQRSIRHHPCRTPHR